MNDRRALLIFGMHRSGTSALTRILNLRGASLPEDLLPANAFNVSGYWEPAAIVTLHDQLLEEAGSRWDDPTGFLQPWFEAESETGRGSVERIAEVVAAEFGESPLIVIKDPRACRMVPAWKAALARLGIEPLVVLTVRHPFEVAASLHRRDGMPQAQALLLWLQHQLVAEAETRSLARVIVTYDQVLDDWRGVLARIDRHFDLRLAPTTREADRGIEAFLDPSLRHERASPAGPDGQPEVASWLRRVHGWYEQASLSDAGIDAGDLDVVRDEVARADQVYAPLLRWYRRREREQEQLGLSLERRQLEAAEGMRHEIALWQQRAEESERRCRDLASRMTAGETQLREAGHVQDDLRQQIRMMESSWFWQMRARLNSLLGR